MEVIALEANPGAGYLSRTCLIVLLFLPASLLLVSVISSNRSDLPLATIATSVTDYLVAHGDFHGEGEGEMDGVVPGLRNYTVGGENEFPAGGEERETGTMIGCSEGNSLPGCQESQRARSRLRRSLTFPEGSKASLRVNFKYLLFPTSSWLAYANGFRAAWELPKNGSVSLPFARSIQRREIFRDIEEIMVHHGLDGRACILRGLCEASRTVSLGSGIIKRVLHLLFTVPEGEEHHMEEYGPEAGGWRRADDAEEDNECESIFSACPFSLLHITSLKLA